MFPTDFDESNNIADVPNGVSRDDCEPLNVWEGQDPKGQHVVISCWKPTREELEEINKTGRIWCWHFGTFLQPHALGGENPFK